MNGDCTTIYILYNPYAGSSDAESLADEAKKRFPHDETTAINLIGMSLAALAKTVKETDTVVLCGGDGTLNRFINEIGDTVFPCPLLLYHAGTGNDFMNDVAENVVDNLVPLTPYLQNLPVVTVNGKQSFFINGIGFGIDGVACEIADDLKAKGKTKISYAAITVKQLLFRYKCPNARVTVDGETREYKRVWLASAMKGRYYGGGMLIAPEQDRNGSLLTSVVLHGGMRIKALLVFTGIFKGTHVKHKEMTELRAGREISVEFDRPTALQIDGETVRNVTSYTVKFPSAIPEKSAEEKEAALV